jgi:hypothetical protein
VAAVTEQVLASDLTLDRLPEAGPSLDVYLLEAMQFGSATASGSREPHRHDYHELIWTREGSGRDLIDGEVSLVEPNTVTAASTSSSPDKDILCARAAEPCDRDAC